MIFGIRWRAAGWASLVWACGFAAAGAAEPAPRPRDTLVYKDGDRLHGHLVGQSADTIVFKSERFGELRVPAANAVVIKADKTAETPAKSAPVVAQGSQPTAMAVAKPTADHADEERLSIWDRFTPALLTARVREIFGPWHGKLAFSAEVVSDVAERENSSWEATLSRKWKADDLQLSARYDYAETDNVTTTDMTKASGQWRHEFNKQLFVQYRPTGEWNRASKRKGVANDYVLLQQELGIGYHLLTRPGRKVRAGISENRFDIWNSSPPAEHTARDVQSLFEEVELTLPWRMALTQRGVWYPVRDQQDGWENRIELNKKLTETLSTAVRHEIRRDNPDGSAQDYTRLKLLFGLDF
ncbi:MAG TPA: DUF481 domain-containing protein [Opitutaceae bacterium]|nr:DUF481 domain-containing protein [Opitutaceae bacterium]